MKARYLLAVAAILAGSPCVQAQSPQPTPAGGQYRVSQCLVTLIDQVDVPAREPGIITDLTIKEGLRVKLGQQLGQINDRDAQSRLKAATSDLQISKAQADSKASVLAAEATVGVAQTEYEKSVTINDTQSGAVSNFELERLRLTAVRAGYQAEVAKLEQLVSQLTWNVRAAQVESVENELMRRKIAAPLEGVVLRKYRHVGEWVNAGDPVCRIVRMDRLRVEGMVFAKHISRAEIKNRPVSVEVQLERGRQATLKGMITYASPVVDSSGHYVVFAEFDNPQVNDVWPVRPGLDAEMIVHIDKNIADELAPTGGRPSRRYK